MKKLICSTLALLMIVTTISGCTNKENSTPNSITTEYLTNSVTDSNTTESSDTNNSDIPTTETEQPSDSTTADETIVPANSKLTEQQKNSVAMLFYLNMVSQKIESSKNNRIYLEEVYSSLLNDTNPSAVDKKTQDHLQTMLTIIKDYRQLKLKRDRLEYIYEQDKASSIKSAMPSPTAVLNVVQSSNWMKLLTSVLYTATSSYTNYKSANDSLDKQFMLNGWELDDEETENIHKNRTRAFNYMVDIVREYELPGYLALNEDFINNFVEAISNTNSSQKQQYLKSHEEIYSAFGPYWLEMAKCSFELKDYQNCLECLSNYESIGTSIFRYDYQYAEFMPMAIVAAQSIYAENTDEYVKIIEKYTDILNSPYQNRWDLKYFAAQSYMDLYAKIKKIDYLKKAYEIAKDNVNSLVKEQESLNLTYLNDVQKLVLSDSDSKLLTKAELKTQQKELDKLNKLLKEKRKTELPELYEPLVVNCELLFSLAKLLEINDKEKSSINGILSGAFIVDPIAEKFSFNMKHMKHDYSVNLSEDDLVIPASILTSSCSVSAVRNSDDEIITDFILTKVDRTDSSVSSFLAHYKSKKMASENWEVGDTITITISNGNNYDSVVSIFEVKEVKKGVWNWIKGIFGSDKVIFECIG